jgi:hypothetical protein
LIYGILSVGVKKEFYLFYLVLLFDVDMEVEKIIPDKNYACNKSARVGLIYSPARIQSIHVSITVPSATYSIHFIRC